MFQVFLPVFFAFFVAYLSTPLVIKMAVKFGAVDTPDERKVHTRIMPRMGGLAIYCGFIVAVLLTQTISVKLLGLLIGCTMIILLGIIDDIKVLSPKVKLLGQILAAIVIVLSGIRVDFLTNPFADIVFFDSMIFTVPITLLWIVGVTNAVNLIDGLDGLAAGTSGIAAVTIAVVSFMEGHVATGTLALILAGSVFGFLPFNFNPAKVFMGDTGSMFLGFTLSVLAITGLTKSATFVSLFIPIVILGIPIFDTAFAIVRRFLNGAPIFQADKGHLHHQLLYVGLTHKQSVLAIYAVNICLAGSAILMSTMAPPQAVMILVGLAALTIIGMNQLSFKVVAKRHEVKDFGA